MCQFIAPLTAAYACAESHPGSTTQGGSNFGQGSNDLGKYSDKQGSEENAGANYSNEQGWNNEVLRTEDMKDTVSKADERHANIRLDDLSKD